MTLEPLEDRALLSTCHVTRPSDHGIGRGFRGDLRYCINKVNAESGPDAIDFNVTGTINLTSALPHLTSDIEIQGPGADLLTVRRNASQRFRIFTVPSGATVEISGLTISNGEVFSGGDGYGGGIYNAGSMTIRECVVADNKLETYDFAYGGGIYNIGELTVIDSTVAANIVHASLSFGGGIYNAGTASIYSSTISGNFSGTDNNDVGSGGGISNRGVLLVVNSTIDSNRSWNGVGGGVFINEGLTEIRNCTITDNVSEDAGGGIYIGSNSVHLRNTIVDGNVTTQPTTYSEDIWGTLSSSGYNLIGNGSGGNGYAATDILNVNAMLGDLADNGGPTQTRALLAGSPAIDAGDNTDAPQWDQRGPGYTRIVNGTIDIGAYEVQANREAINDLAVLTTADFHDSVLKAFIIAIPFSARDTYR